VKAGLVGTGPWARAVHGPGLAASEAVDLVGVWGRDAGRTAALAAELGARPYTDYDALLADVELATFAVPPAVQAGLALRAAGAGKHLLLDKPIAIDVETARRLAAAVSERDVASVVFFTDRFAESAGWIEETRRTGGWLGGSLRWLAALGTPGNPYAQSQWRWDRGALWDIGPHALSTLSATLGPITSIEAMGGPLDLVHLVLTHESGATSTASLSLQVPPEAVDAETVLWGEHGLTRMPARREDTARVAFANAVAHLVAAASGAHNPVDVHFGVRVVELLVAAERRLGTR
jgi:predicted dehydrogenase